MDLRISLKMDAKTLFDFYVHFDAPYDYEDKTRSDMELTASVITDLYGLKRNRAGRHSLTFIKDRILARKFEFGLIDYMGTVE